MDLRTIDETKNLIALVNNRFIFPHAKLSYMMRSVDEEAERFVLVVKVLPLTPYNGYMKSAIRINLFENDASRYAHVSMSLLLLISCNNYWNVS